MRRWAGRLPCPRAELRLELVLRCGQAFRWRESSPGHWTGVLAGRVWTLTQTDEQLCYTVYEEEEEEEGGSCKKLPQSEAPGSLYSEAPALEPLGGADSCEAQKILRDYFQLDVNLAALYQAWGTLDPHFQQVAANFPGVRVLRQDPVECLFSFLCTSNNHLARITGMIERLCQAFGRHLCQLDMQPHHAFPSLQALAGADTEGRLRALGFGYRARFVHQSAQAVLEQFGAQGLHQLRSVPYPEAKRLLCTLPGVGAKVADCVCLMALDKTEAVPVDTHMWQIARRDYGLQLGTGAHRVPGRQHSQLGDFFQRLWGPYAGWAQAVLFCADLKLFQQVPGPWRDPAAALAPRGPTDALEARGQHWASPATTQTLGPGSAPAPGALPGKRRRGENSCTRPGPQP